MNNLRLSCLCLILGLMLTTLKAQRINDFNLSPMDGGILVSFNIGPGLDCSGYSIFHCLDSVSYLEIYNFAGICGTSGTNEFRSFTHSTPTLNQINYYKIQLYPYEVAYNKILYSNSSQGSLLAFPNPISSNNTYLNLRLANTSNVKVEGYICDDFGMKVQAVNSQTSGDLLQLSVSGFKEGVYLVWLSDGARIFTTKFIVLN